MPCRILAGFLIVTLSLPPYAFANPQGGQVRQGQVRIQNLDGQLRVHQESQRAVIDWESFSIDRGEVTRFLQPNANAAALNRVRGAAASQIEGMLRANGKVYLINPNGILIGPNGSIDVGGFVASTLDTDDGDFMRGGDLRFAGNSDAAIINLGSISALDGDVVLMAGSVLNEGRIRAPRGTAALAAGNDILLIESGEERVFVRGSGGSKKAEGVTNTGEIEANIAELKAHGGNIYGMAVKNEGRVAATGVTRSGGQIFLSAGGGRVRSTGTLKAKRSDGSGGKIKVDSGTAGKTEIGGTVDASGEHGAGGEIAILGNEIEVFDGTLILNDGETMGGTTRIGGGRRGEDPAFANAEFLTVGSGSLISANARGSGDGGEIVLFANDTTTLHGVVSAQGGTLGGNGGFIELSGRNRLFVPDLVGQVRLSAPIGNSGSLLLDPANINVIHGTGGGILGTTMTDGALMDVLANFPVLIWTSDYGSIGDGDITFAADVNLAWSTPYSLTFQADRDLIFLGGAQIFASGSGAFNATAARSISVGNGASIRTTNGNLTLSANTAGTHLDTFDGIDINAGTVQVTGSGNLTLTGKGGLGGGADPSGVVVRAGGAVIGGTSGSVTVTGTGGSGTSNDTGSSNLVGVLLEGTNSRITSSGATVQVNGIGGTSTGPAAGGVLLINGGLVSAGGNGSVAVTGSGGAGTRFSYGVDAVHNGSMITSNNGTVTVTGTGGTGTLGDHWGVVVQLGAMIAAGGTHAVSVNGTGGFGAGGNNHGVVARVDSGGFGRISSGGGNITVTGTEGTGGTDNLGINVQNGGTITTATNGGDITLIADRMGLANTVATNSAGTLTLRQKTNGIAINLGSTIDTTAGILELSESELDAIVAGTLQIGNNNTGQITVSSGITHGNHLSLTTGAGITINNAITMDPGKNSTLNAVGTVNFANTNADLAATGSGAISITTARNISLASGASVTTVNGNLTLSANQQVIPTSGNFAGILIDGGTVESTGTGVLSAVGKGGDTGGGNIGIAVDNGGKIIGGTSGITLLTGTGGGSSGSENIGVRVIGTNSLLSTNNSNLSVFGYGGGTGAASGSNSGVFVSLGGVITSGALGGVSIEGTGGAGGGLNNKGVWISQFSPSTFGTITSGGGFVSITGTGGGSGTSSNNQGVDVVGSNVILSTGGGALTVTGTAGLNTLNQAVRLGGSVSTVGNQPITIIGDSFSNLSGLLNSGTGITSIRPLTNNLAIDLGGADVGGTTLGLSDAELDSITAGTVQIGNSNTGLITVSSGITHGNHLSLTTGAGVTINNAITMASNRNFTTNAVSTIHLATSSADLSASGTGTISLTTARNVSLADNSSITTTLGDLTLSANASGTTSGLFEGIYLGNGASLNSGTGQISLTGKGGDASNGGNHGIRLDTSSLILSLGGNIELDGTGIGASGSNPSQEGIVLQGDIQTEGPGSITITGRGGNALGGNIGVNIFNTSQVYTENGNIEITGTSGGGADSPGVQLADFGDSSVAIRSNAGNITIKGESPSDLNPGILAFGFGVSVGGGTGNVTLESIGTTRFFNGAKIDALGGGSVSLTATRTIFLGASTSATTENGSLTLSANQQVAPTPGNFAGIHVNGATVGSLGMGAVSLTGRGGDSGGNNYGVQLNGGAQVMGGTTNELVITGYGGAGEWAINTGVLVSDLGTLVSSLGGNVILSGTGGTSLTTDSSSGVMITGSSTITSGTGASVTIVGQGGAGANYNNRGVFIVSPFANNPTTVSTGGGNLQITGTGGGTSTSLGDHGVDIAYGNSFPNVGSNGGTVTITGIVGPNPLNDGVRIDGSVTTTGNQNIQLYSNRLNITGGASLNSGSGTTQLLPSSNGFEVNVGGADSPGALGIADGELDRISAGTILVGSTTSGLLTVSAPITSGNHLFLQSGSGAVVQNSIAMAANRNLRIETLGANLGTLSLATADADLYASGTGAITLISPRDIVLTPGSSITTVNGNINLSANQNSLPTPGSFSGIDINAANLSSTGTGSVILWGRGGNGTGDQHGILLRAGASLSTNGQNLTLSGATPDTLSSGLRIELASLGAGGGTIQLTGDGGTTSINSTDSSTTIGSATDTVLMRSNSGDVTIDGQVQGADLQLQDFSGTESVDFVLTNTANDLDRINSFSSGSNGRIASLDFRDSDGFSVTEFLGASGVSASGNITLRSNFYSGSSVVVDRPVRSAGGNVLLHGLDVVIDGADATTTGSGSLTLEAGRAILVQGDSLLSVTNGAMRLEANRGEGSLEGNFTGITILGSRVRSLGLGGITLAGTGGDGTTGSDFAYPGFTNPSSNGIRLDGGTVISSIDSSTSDFGIELYGSGGEGASDSVGIVMAGADTSISSAGRSVLIEGFGGGQSTGQRNRGLLFTGGFVQASGNANVTLFGAGGAGINENDGIQLNGNARVQAEDGAIVLDGYAGDTLGIGVILGNTAGDISITGSGSVDVNGTGRNAAGIVLGNSAAMIGGIDASYVDLFANESDIRLQRNLIASGDIFLNSYAGDVFVEGEVTSEEGDIEIDGDNITIDAPVTASNGNITLFFGDQPPPTESEPEVLEIRGPFFDGTATINDLLSADGTVLFVGGDGTGDTLTFAGYTASEISLWYENLMNVEFVVGTGSSNDQVQGPSVSSNYQFTGPNAFNVGGVAFSAFENVLAGGGDDIFAFNGTASIAGALDGGTGANTLDYSGYATGVVVDLPLGAATGIVGGFENISNFSGSGNIDTITGPGSASTYEFTGPDALQVGSVSMSGFENLIAGPLEDNFVFLPGSSLRGYIDGGFSPTPVVNHLDYSRYGASVAVNLGGSPLPLATGIAGGFSNLNQFTGSALLTDQFFGSNLATSYQITGPNAFSSSLFTATGFENLTGGLSSDTFIPGPGAALSGRLSGGTGAGTDTLDYSIFGRAVTVNIGPNTATGMAGGFSDLERIIGSPGNDRFNFLNQTTIQFVDGGGGTDLLEINDSDLGGDNTYDITATSVSRNPLYTFNNFEALRLYLGRGNNTVNSGFFPYTQFIHGGRGFNTLNLPGVTSLNEGNPIRNVYHYGISAPRPEGPDTGGLLQLEVNQRNSANPNTQQGFNTENRFSIVDPGTLSQQIGALSGAFAAAVTAQAALIVVDGNPYLVFRPFSLDGSGIAPSNLAAGALNESLGVDANLELASAIGYTGPIFLFNPDGAHGLDLSGAPVDPVILTLLQESLAIAAAAELSAALGLNLVVSITATDGIVPIVLDNAVPGQPIVLLLSEQLGDPAANELNAALGAN